MMNFKKSPAPVKSIEPEEARSYINGRTEGTYTLLDVRQPGENQLTRIPGSKLIPLPELADRINELDPEKPVITY
ncbi:MAG: sulfur-carrier protein adenylyltransferase/sulfurtransferase [Thermodesulfobacteriota bacterium]|nr:sulfur-carrier protein adenylyltransferase/sulfurtransferase [Thermodesulfobacteriota bacterium]